MKKREFNKKLELTNDGQLSLFFIGTGNSFSHTYFQTNVLVVKGKEHILIDCGTLCAFIVETFYNSDIGDIDNLLVTHAHSDHVGGLEEIAFTAKYRKHKTPNLIITDEFKKKLWNQTLKGGIHYSEYGLLDFSDYFNQIKPEKIENTPFPLYEYNLGDLNLKIFRTRHITLKDGTLKNSQLSYGVIIDNKILFTGDSQFNPKQLNWILSHFDIQCIFHDCDMKGDGSVHATYNQLKTLDSAVKGKMMLYHYNSARDGIDATTDGFAGFTEKGLYYDF